MSFTNDLKNVFRGRDNGLIKLIVINSIVFVVVNVLDEILKMSSSGFRLGPWFALPDNFSSLLFRPWTIISYMFMHFDLLHIFFNMLWLYFLGKIFSEYMGSRRLVFTYLLGGIAGGLLYILTSSIIDGRDSILVGASAGVTAVIIGVCAYAPNMVVHLFLFGPVRLKYIGLISFVLFTLLDLSSNTGGKISHMGGALFGLLYGSSSRNGNDFLKGMSRKWEKVSSGFSSKPKMRTAHRAKKVSDEEYNLNKALKQKRIDEILDKISKSGYDSLSREEKDFLFNASK